MDTAFYALTKQLEHERNVRLAEIRIRHLGYGRRGIEQVPVERLPVRRLAGALARRLDAWASGASTARPGVRA